MHDWNDEHCVKILKNCLKALPDSGKVIIAEMVLPMTPIPTTDARRVFQVDMVMLAYIPGGKERTQREYESLAKAAGFSEIKAVCCAYNTWVMEIYKQDDGVMDPLLLSTPGSRLRPRIIVLIVCCQVVFNKLS